MSGSEVRRFALTVNPGLLVGVGFGFVFLVANSGAPLPATLGLAVKGVGGAAVVAVLWAQMRWGGDGASHRPDLGRAFRLVVAAEVVIGAAGLAGLRLGGAPWQANVAWIAAVVGAHFLALAVVWGDAGISVVGGVMMTTGVVGLALAATGTIVEWIPSICGVISGFTLVTGSLAASIGARGSSQRAGADGSSPPRRLLGGSGGVLTSARATLPRRQT